MIIAFISQTQVLKQCLEIIEPKETHNLRGSQIWVPESSSSVGIW